MSNLGAFPASAVPTEPAGTESQTWRIGEVLFAQAGATLGAALKLNVVGTPAGGLGVSITWGKGAVEDELAEEFVREFEAGVRGLLGAA